MAVTFKRQEKAAIDPEWSRLENERIYAALCRAAKKARQRAIDDEGFVATWRDGKIVYDTEA